MESGGDSECKVQHGVRQSLICINEQLDIETSAPLHRDRHAKP
jgi:hypothetical protein